METGVRVDTESADGGAWSDPCNGTVQGGVHDGDACDWTRVAELCVQRAMQSKARLLDGLARRYRHAVRSKFKPRTRQSDVLQPTLPRGQAAGGRRCGVKRPRLVWHDAELELMLAAVRRVGVRAWQDVARVLPGRSAREARDMYTAVRAGHYHHSSAGLTSASRCATPLGSPAGAPASSPSVPRGKGRGGLLLAAGHGAGGVHSSAGVGGGSVGTACPAATAAGPGAAVPQRDGSQQGVSSGTLTPGQAQAYRPARRRSRHEWTCVCAVAGSEPGGRVASDRPPASPPPPHTHTCQHSHAHAYANSARWRRAGPRKTKPCWTWCHGMGSTWLPYNRFT